MQFCLILHGKRGDVGIRSHVPANTSRFQVALQKNEVVMAWIDGHDMRKTETSFLGSLQLPIPIEGIPLLYG